MCAWIIGPGDNRETACEGNIQLEAAPTSRGPPRTGIPDVDTPLAMTYMTSDLPPEGTHCIKAFSIATTLVVAGGAASVLGVKVNLGVKDIHECIHLLITFHLFLMCRSLRVIGLLRRRRRSLHPPCAQQSSTDGPSLPRASTARPPTPPSLWPRAHP
jgi:hypothetical protein